MSENNKNKRSKLLIYCEGETEKQYLMAIAEALKITSNVSIRKTAACSPIQLLEFAYKDFQWSQVVDKEFPFTEYWLVFDRDHHPSYENTFTLAATMSPAPHLAWTNPCIEFWFWLHYSGNRENLKFDEEVEVSNNRTEKVLDNDEVEITTVRRVRRTIKPETMLKLLKGHIQGYSKVVCPPGIVERSGKACDNLLKVAQSTNPMVIGSSIPELLLRLAHLQDELRPEERASASTTQTNSVAPSSMECEKNTKLPPVLVTSSSVMLSTSIFPLQTIEAKLPTVKEIEKALTAEPSSEVPLTENTTVVSPDSKATVLPVTCKIEDVEPSVSKKKHVAVDPNAVLLEPLKLCLRDWAFIRVTTKGLECPKGTLEHWDSFCSQAARLPLDSKTRARGEIGVGILKNMRKLLIAIEANPNKDRAEKVAGKLYAMGNLLSYFAEDLGISGILRGLSFVKQTPRAEIPAKQVMPLMEQTKMNRQPIDESQFVVSEKQPEVVSTVVLKQETQSKEHSLEAQLSQTAEELHGLRNRFYALVSGMVLSSDGIKAFEITPGYCERSAILQEEAARILNDCTELVSSLPASGK